MIEFHYRIFLAVVHGILLSSVSARVASVRLPGQEYGTVLIFGLIERCPHGEWLTIKGYWGMYCFRSTAIVIIKKGNHR